ncbi:alkylglycerone-phosphate synthase [Diabrotica undecimpunctata]|uniref:alkylglycerone-phosphate synthase n=1 Tax=Diabrotica undecimpunctata TaxID=50387 RepID=UPI003B6327BF
MSKSNQENQLKGPIIVKSVIPKNRQELIKWNGWGYNDSKFVIKEGPEVYFSGKRYLIGELRLPHIVGWVQDTFNIDLGVQKPKKIQELPNEDKYPKPNITDEVLEQISKLGISYSTKVIDRLIRAHGQTLHEIYTIQNSTFERIPDVVLWPTCHDDVVKIVTFAQENNIVIIPYGGGTAVSGAPECPKHENRTIICLDTSQMNRILWLDKENLVACFESGIVGQDMERELKKLGYTSGHEPDSYEFSTLGGWVATRASGMKKNVYGNIEDLVVHVKMVTPKGVLQKNCQVPRLSCGPDFNHIILGSEGSLGVITEVLLKIRPLPKCKKYGSIVFPSFEKGVEFMREVAKRKWQPASIRLMDNEQFKFALILKPESTYFGLVLDGIKKFYITMIKGFDPDYMCVMTLLFEGEESEVKINEKNLYNLCKNYGGFPAGEQNGERGYMLTFVIAYIRDLGLQFEVVAESFETSVPWDRAVKLVRNVKHVVADECRQLGITHFLINCRVTQTYDAGCVIYFYLGFNHCGLGDPVTLHNRLETRARDEIVASGGSISHHHGVGKLRQKWYPSTVSDVGVGLYLAAKNELDPKNIFATNNLVQSKL